jgi:hypothetical protein
MRSSGDKCVFVFVLDRHEDNTLYVSFVAAATSAYVMASFEVEVEVEVEFEEIRTDGNVNILSSTYSVSTARDLVLDSVMSDTHTALTSVHVLARAVRASVIS